MDAILFHPETSQRRAPILALGNIETKLSADEREPLVEQLLEVPQRPRCWDSWGGGMDATAVEAATRGSKPRCGAAEAKDRGDRRWYVNSEGQTLAVIEGPVEFQWDRPSSEPDRIHRWRRYTARPINRRFAIATKEVTVSNTSGL